MAKMETGRVSDRQQKAGEQQQSQEILQDRQEIQALAAQRFSQVIGLGKSILKATVQAGFSAAAYVERRVRGEGSLIEDLQSIKGKVVSTATELVAERQLQMQDKNFVALQSKIDKSGASPSAKSQLSAEITDALEDLNKTLKAEVTRFRSKPLSEQTAAESYQMVSSFKQCKAQVLSFGNQLSNALEGIHQSDLKPEQKAVLEKKVFELADTAAKSLMDKLIASRSGSMASLAELKLALKDNADFAKTIRHTADHAVSALSKARETGSPEVVRHVERAAVGMFDFFRSECEKGKAADYATPQYRDMLREYAKYHGRIVQSMGDSIIKIETSNVSQESKELAKAKYLEVIIAGEKGFAAEMNRQVEAGTWRGMESLKPLLERGNRLAKLSGATVEYSIKILSTGEATEEVPIANRARNHVNALLGDLVSKLSDGKLDAEEIHKLQKQKAVETKKDIVDLKTKSKQFRKLRSLEEELARTRGELGLGEPDLE